MKLQVCCLQDLEDGMLAHLRLNFSNEQASDETVRPRAIQSWAKS